MLDKPTAKPLQDYEDFPGARILRMSFKTAVEEFTKAKYQDRIGKDLTLVDIGRDTPELREAITEYKKRFGTAPFGIPSIRDVAYDRVARVLENGFRGTRLDRQAAMTMLKRQSAKLSPS